MKEIYEISPSSYNLYNYWHRIIACILGITLLLLPLVYNVNSSSWQSCLIGQISSINTQTTTSSNDSSSSNVSSSNASSKPLKTDLSSSISSSTTLPATESSSLTSLTTNITTSDLDQSKNKIVTQNNYSNNTLLNNADLDKPVIDSHLTSNMELRGTDTENGAESLEVHKTKNNQNNLVKGQANTTYSNVNKYAPPSTRVYFQFNQYTLPKNVDQALSKVVNYMMTYKQSKVILTGYHDRFGTKELLKYNKQLAVKRASSVRRALIQSGISQSRIILSKPKNSVGSGTNSEARRVDMKVIK